MSNKDPKGMPRKENRESAQKKVDQVIKDLGLTKSQGARLHDELREDYLPYEEIRTRGEGIQEEDEGKWKK